MLRFLFFVVVWMSAGRAVGQDWRTVRVGDTTYFGASASAPQGSYSRPGDTLSLRSVWIASVVANGADTSYNFFAGIRSDNHSACLDTNAASWLGPRMVRRSNGDEYYFNSFGDTISLKPSASIGASWKLVEDTGGRAFVGTITSAGVVVVDGVTDSAKQLSIQAYNGATPVAHSYNSLILEWSKSHGWLKTLDFYRFPNALNTLGDGTLIISTQHARLPKVFAQLNLDSVNIAAKYASGAEWTWSSNTGNIVAGYTYTNGHDSVIASTPWGSGVIATIRRRTLSGSQFADVTLLDTFQATTSAPRIIREHIRPEFKDLPMHLVNISASHLGIGHPLGRWYGVEALCGGNLFRIADRKRYAHSELAPGSCFKIVGSTAGVQGYKHLDVVPGFGTVYTEFAAVPGTWPGTGWYLVTYFSMAGCTVGLKAPVNSLGMHRILLDANTAMLSPNPTSNSTRILNLPNGQHHITLRDATGRILLSLQTTGTTADIPTAHLPSGVYFVEVSNATGRTTLKLQVLH